MWDRPRGSAELPYSTQVLGGSCQNDPAKAPFCVSFGGFQCFQSYLLSSPNVPLPWRLSPSNLANKCPCISERRLRTLTLPFLKDYDSRNSMSPSCTNIVFRRLSLLISNSVCLVNSYSSSNTLFRHRFCEGFIYLFPPPGQKVCQLYYKVSTILVPPKLLPFIDGMNSFLSLTPVSCI